MMRVLNYGGDAIDYEVRFLSSRRTLAIEVHPDSRVIVRAPVGCPENVISERVRMRAEWIVRQLAEFARYRPRTPERRYVCGETHLYLGRQYRLKPIAAPSPSVKLTRGQLLVAGPGVPDSVRVKALLQSWYLSRGRAVFGEVIGATLPKFKVVDAPRLVVRRMQSRWGSLSSHGTLTLNSRLIQAPKPCIEYVVAHELCHLTYRNHDTKFFGLLERVMPDWRGRKARLEEALL